VTDTLTADLVDASKRVLDVQVALPTGLETEPLTQRWSDLRKHLEALGWFDLLGAPEAGGLGLSPALAVRLLRLSGTFLVPGPLIDTVLTVPWLLTRPGVRGGLLSDARLSVVTVDPCHDLPGSGLELRDGRVHGTARCVLGAPDADALLLHVLDGAAERLVVVPSTHAGVRVLPLRSADPCQSVGQVELDCALGDEHLVSAAGDQLPTTLRAWRRLGSAAYLAGISERVLALGVDHALQREQFGRPIGAFQAIQHLLSDVAVIARSLANLVDFAAEELATDQHEAAIIGATAKARAGSESVLACETVLQVLGGMGFTVEHPLHHYLKRSLSLAAQDGSPAELNLLAGRLVLAQRR